MKLRNLPIVCLVILLCGCSSPVISESRVWYFQVAAPKHYEVWVEHLELEASGIRHWQQAPGVVSCCWKGDEGPRGKGGRMAPFPDYIGIQWFSFAERAFYQQLIILPNEWKQQMLISAPYETSHGTRYGPRNILTLGLAPRGEIVVWIKNQIGNEIEVARLQANEIEGDASVYKTRVSDYMERSGEYLETHGIPLEGW